MGTSTRLLGEWYAGDKHALAELFELHSPWIVTKSRRLLGANLREKLETGDIVQEANLRFLKYPPSFRLVNEGHFRAFLSKQITNAISERHEWFNAKRRRRGGLYDLLSLQSDLRDERPTKPERHGTTVAL